MFKVRPRHLTTRILKTRCLQRRIVVCRASALKNYKVNFHVKVHVNYGEGIGVVGSTKSLGNWNTKNAIPLKWTKGDIWVANCTLEHKDDVEYKYVKLKSNGELKEWMPGSNLVLELEGDDIVVDDSWEPSRITHSDDSIIDETNHETTKFRSPKNANIEISIRDSINEERDARVMNHSSGKEFDIGGPLGTPCVAYGPDPNPILESLVGSAVLIPMYPFHLW